MKFYPNFLYFRITMIFLLPTILFVCNLDAKASDKKSSVYCYNDLGYEEDPKAFGILRSNYNDEDEDRCTLLVDLFPPRIEIYDYNPNSTTKKSPHLSFGLVKVTRIYSGDLSNSTVIDSRQKNNLELHRGAGFFRIKQGSIPEELLPELSAENFPIKSYQNFCNLDTRNLEGAMPVREYLLSNTIQNKGPIYYDKDIITNVFDSSHLGDKKNCDFYNYSSIDKKHFFVNLYHFKPNIPSIIIDNTSTKSSRVKDPYMLKIASFNTYEEQHKRDLVKVHIEIISFIKYLGENIEEDTRYLVIERIK